MGNELTLYIGELIRKLRQKKGFSQEKLAHLSGTHYTYIGKIERGEKNLTVETLNAVTKALEITLEEFFSYLPDANVLVKEPNLSSLINEIKQLDIEERNRFILIMEDLINWKKSRNT